MSMKPVNADNVPGDYAQALDVLRKIMLEQRYEDFYRGIRVFLVGLDDAGIERRRRFYEDIVLPFVSEHVIGRRLHGVQITDDWKKSFRSGRSGMSWEACVIDSLEKGEDAFAAEIKSIQKSIDEFAKAKE